MKESKKQVEKATVTVGESLNMKEATELLLINIGINSTIRELAYKMFVENKNNYFEKNDDVYQAVELIRKYAKEMSLNGEVKFEQPFLNKKQL
jgi:hypothetical protein